MGAGIVRAYLCIVIISISGTLMTPEFFSFSRNYPLPEVLVLYSIPKSQIKGTTGENYSDAKFAPRTVCQRTGPDGIPLAPSIEVVALGHQCINHRTRRPATSTNTTLLRRQATVMARGSAIYRPTVAIGKAETISSRDLHKGNRQIAVSRKTKIERN
jgi:hypothetical protein